MAPSYVLVANNYFEECNGEVEIISNKSSFNEFRNNIFYKSEGSLVLRHGNYCVVDGNIFIGDGESEAYGGIRVINTGHWITNNYFYNLKGDEFRSPLAVMNGIPKSPLNRYNQVTDVVVAFNTWVNSRTPWHFSVGANLDRKEVLPASEIRSARPERIVIANNIIYEENESYPLIKSYDKVDGVDFHNNLVSKKIEVENLEGIHTGSFDLKKMSENIFLPESSHSLMDEPYPGFEFETIKEDVFGVSREERNRLGAFNKNEYSQDQLPDLNSYGPSWFDRSNEEAAGKEILVSSAAELIREVERASAGTLIKLKKGTYQINQTIPVGKSLKLQGDKGAKLVFNFKDAKDQPLFELLAQADLEIDNLEIKGTGSEIIFAPRAENMQFPYSLSLRNSEISNFDTFLKSYKNSFADEIHIENSSIQKGNYGLLLNAETDDLGDYNAEFVTVRNSEFNKIKNTIIDYYRGGYDESTIGGNLLFKGNTITGSGDAPGNKVLIKNRGIVNVELLDNRFRNNDVDIIAILWGEVGNVDRGNEIKNSGEIKIEQHLKQKLVY